MRKSNHLFLFLLVLGLFIIMISVRFIYLNSDPPTSLTWGGALLTDEGWWTHNAVNKILVGKWVIDQADFNQAFALSPAFTFFQFISFTVFGISFTSARLVSVLFSILTIVFLFLSLKGWVKQRTALLAVMFLGLNYFYIMYNRLALLETTMIFFLVLAFYFWQRGNRGKSYSYCFSGISIYVALLVKPTAIFFILVYIAASLGVNVFKNGKKRIWKDKSFIYFLAGILGVASLWLVFWVLPNYKLLTVYYSTVVGSKLSLSPITYITNVGGFLHTVVFSKMPVISLLSLSYVMICLYILIKNPHKLKATDFLIVSWLLIASAFLALSRYQPPRYYMILIPPMCVASSIVLGKLLSLRSIKVPKLWGLGTFYAIIWVVIFDVVLSASLLATTKLRNSDIILILAVFSIIIMLLLYLFRNNTIKIPSKLSTGVVVALVISCILVNGTQYLNWAVNPEFSLVNTAKEVKTTIGEDVVLSGGIANTLALGNQLFTITLSAQEIANNSSKFKVTHIIIGRKIAEWEEKYPSAFEDTVFLKKFKILKNYKGDYHYLYKLSP